MDNLDSSAWVFDSLVGFLHGPIWNIPLQTFIEEKSLPFEPTENGDAVDKPEYKEIHEEYKNLVDVMLGSFMDDIGITSEQFEAACRMSANDLAGLPAQFHRRLFEQIWAANDYEIFVKMMTHKNVELQLQALELIEKRFGALPSLFSDGDESRSEESDWSDKEEVMSELKKLNLEETESQSIVEVLPTPVEVVAEKKSLLSRLRFEKKDIAKTVAFKEEEEEIQTLKEDSLVEKDKAVNQPKKLGVKGKNDIVKTVAFKKEEEEIQILKEDSLVEKNIAVEQPKKLAVSEEEMKARQEYLKQQRDKLLALKKQVRERKLGEADAESEAGSGEGASRARPHSARAAAAALAGAPPPPPPPDAMHLRRALATRLKTEVVDNPN